MKHYPYRPSNGATMEPRPRRAQRHSWRKVSINEFVCECGCRKLYVKGVRGAYKVTYDGLDSPPLCTR